MSGEGELGEAVEVTLPGEPGSVVRPMAREGQGVSVAVLLCAPKAPGERVGTAKPKVGHMQLDADLAADGVEGKFSLFVRVKELLPEHFSIGLKYQPPRSRGSVAVMLRVNGDHGSHKNPDGSILEGGPHIHCPTEKQLQGEPRTGMKLSWAEPVDARYINWLDAWGLFCRLVNLEPSESLTAKVGEAFAFQLELADDDEDDSYDDDDDC